MPCYFFYGIFRFASGNIYHELCELIWIAWTLGYGSILPPSTIRCHCTKFQTAALPVFSCFFVLHSFPC